MVGQRSAEGDDEKKKKKSVGAKQTQRGSRIKVCMKREKTRINWNAHLRCASTKRTDSLAQSMTYPWLPGLKVQEPHGWRAGGTQAPREVGQVHVLLPPHGAQHHHHGH